MNLEDIKRGWRKLSQETRWKIITIGLVVILGIIVYAIVR